MPTSSLDRGIALLTASGENEWLLERLVGREEIGRGYTYEADLRSSDREFDFDSILGQPVAVRLDRAGGGPKFLHGIVSDFRQTSVDGELAGYRATIVPFVDLLDHTQDCRIFQDRSAVEIVLDILRSHGFSDFEDLLTEEYPKRDYCVQWRESDRDFVHRLLEEEGIATHYRHEIDRHVWVLTDSPACFAPDPDGGELVYRSEREARYGSEGVWNLEVVRRLCPSRTSLGSYDYTTPRKDLETRSAAARHSSHAEFETYDYAGRHVDRERGERQARVRLEAAQGRHVELTALTDSRRVAVGEVVTPVDTPREEDTRPFLVLRTELEVSSNAFRSDGNDDDPLRYSLRLHGVPAEQPYRPEPRTRRPEVAGCQTAIVVGPADQEIWTDELGRVKVQFHWDRSRKFDETSSCWIRVAHPTAGKGWGAVSIPRVGTEVVVEFLDGDPDRPLITGSVYNGRQQPPYPLPQQATTSGMRSRSSTDSDGFNELRFEDRSGEEQVFLRAERDFDLVVQNDRRTLVGGAEHVVVEKTARREYRQSTHDTVGGSQYRQVAGEHHVAIDGQEAMRIGGDRSVSIDGNSIEVVGGDREERAANTTISSGSITLKATDSIKLECGGSVISIGPGGIKIEGPKVTTLTSGFVVDSSVMQLTGGNLDVMAQTKIDGPTTLTQALQVAGVALIGGTLSVGGAVITPSVVASSYTPGAGNVM